MTSANVTEYSVKDLTGKEVYVHYQNCLCKTKWHKLLEFTPAENYTIMPFGEDEEEAEWEGERISLAAFIEKLKKNKADFTPWEMDPKWAAPKTK